MRFDLGRASLGRLLGVVFAALTISVTLDIGAYLAGIVVNPLLSAVIAVAAAVLFWLSRSVTLGAVPLVWDPPPLEPVRLLPRNRDVTMLAHAARGSVGRDTVTRRELVGALRAVTAERLVRRHGADPADPFATATGLLSPSLVALLTGQTRTTSLRRRTLGAYLKEIDAL